MLYDQDEVEDRRLAHLREGRIADALTVVLLGAFIVVGLFFMLDRHPDPRLLGPCPTEDSTNCYWDAQTMGNGEGHDFVIIEQGD